MLVIWLNRLGIILNFLAGFLVAPELLGIHRLESAEARLERFTQGGRNWLKQRYFPFMEGEEPVINTQEQVFILSISAIFWLFSWWAWHLRSWTLAIVPVLCYLAEVFVILGLSAMAGGPMRSVIRFSLWCPLYHVTVNLLLSIYQLVVFGVAKVAYKFLGRLLRALEGGDNRLRFLLVPVGIVFFIVGNLLQFIATF